jgi:hypothetical protein
VTASTAPRWLGPTLLAVAIVVAAALLAGGLGRIRQGADEVEVTGSARRAIQSDFAVWRATLNTQDAALPEAYRRLRADRARLIAFLRARQVPESLLIAQAVGVSSIQDYDNGQETGRIVAYRLWQTFELRTAEVGLVTRLSQEVTELIGEGVGLAPQPPEYLFTGLPRLRIEMLAEATADAKARADAIASGVGATVGAVRNVRVGVFQITPRHSTEVSDYGVNDTSSLEKDVTAVVRVTFTLR